MDRIDWLNRRCLKLLKRKSKEKKERKRQGRRQNEYNKNKRTYKNPSNHERREYRFEAPSIFSLDKNPEETVEFFNKIITKRNLRRFGSLFFIDASNVIEIDIEALMYIIAIIKDTKNNLLLKYGFGGNFPENGEARKVFTESGFLSYVKSNQKYISPTNNKIQIINGKLINVDEIKRICLFIQNTCIMTKIDTRPLYNVLVELMGNTAHHAYKDVVNGDISSNSWFMYAEEEDDYVEFVFLDTGVGIPNTVHKKFHEKFILPVLGEEDSKYIKSTLLGEFRTETRQKNRGTGLPELNRVCKEGLLSNMVIYSGRGCCKIVNYEGVNNYVLSDMSKISIGTLFKWKIYKRKGGN